MYLQLTPVMRNVLTMRNGGAENGEGGGGRNTSGRLMLEGIVMILIVYLNPCLSVKGELQSHETG